MKYQLENTEYLGQKAVITYEFFGIVNSVEEQALSYIKVDFIDELNKEQETEIWETIKNNINTYEVETMTQGQTILSKAKSTDLPEELQEKANAYMKEVYRLHQKELNLKDPDKYDFTKATQMPLSRVRVGFTPNTVEFWGEGIAYVELFAKLSEG